MAASLLLIAVFVVVGTGMLLVGTGLATRAAGDLGAALGAAFSRLTSQAPPTAPPPGAELDTPTFEAPPDNGYTNQKNIDLSGTIPAAAAGKSGYMVRVYAVQQDRTRLMVAEVPVGATVRFTATAVPLTEGPNTFIATLVGPNGPGAESPPVVYTLDTTPPTIKITAPASSTLIKTAAVVVAGKTEAKATVTVRNTQLANGGGVSGLAGADGKFQVSIGLVPGSNALTITATDQAGNAKSVSLTVRRDLGKLSAHLTAAPNKIDVLKATRLTLTVRVTSADGSPLANATVVFTVEVHGVGPITSPELKTDASGSVSFSTTITGATPGPGNASVLVTTPSDGQVSGNTPITTY